jgi:hypothetical protein
MEMKPVKSSNIKAIGYDPATQTLAVEFNHGGLYHYANVPAAAHQELVSAKSIGGHLHQHIKNVFEAKRQAS